MTDLSFARSEDNTGGDGGGDAMPGCDESFGGSAPAARESVYQGSQGDGTGHIGRSV